jgi:ATP-dependent Clp protease ATP-binding subunit ClpB
MQHEIDDQLARALLSGDIRDGDTVLVGVGDDGLTVSRLDDVAAGPSDGQDDVIEAELLDE